ncbi:DUF3221 domain-containing protein [Virgibacillus salexigens]|uniref:DUF3221 domain-containing protein n=1 Tax=Virgibacillus salexigens TaxID=61016 RepID=UPI00190D7090|nr:DUF3221 domain-containing protein [Virgibacillus salexigens]
MLRKSVSLCYLIILLISVVGCAANENQQKDLNQDFSLKNLPRDAGKEGYVIQKGETTFLFAPTWQEELLEKYEESKLGINYPDAMSVNLSDVDINLVEIEVGQPIRVWFDSILEGWPPSGHAVKIEIIEK